MKRRRLCILYKFVEQNLYAWLLSLCNYNKYILLYARYEYADVQEYEYTDVHEYEYANEYELVET